MKKIVIVFAAIMCMASMCVPEENENYHRTVRVTNNADYPVYVVCDVFSYGKPEFPWGKDDVISESDGIKEPQNIVNPGETNTTAMAAIRRTDSIEGYVMGRQVKVFFVDAVRYNQIPIGSRIPDEMLLDSRVYDLESLRAINFHINYPLE